LIFELLIEAHRFGTDLGENKTLIKIRQSDLAARSGLARETVSRELHKLEARRLLGIAKRGIIFKTDELEKALDINF
jgi:DNA-binding transcriptional regulator LsrR (DeoR family)